MKVWLDKKETLSVAGEKIAYGDKFDEKLLHKGTLKLLSEQNRIGDKIVTEADLVKVAESAAVEKLKEKQLKELDQVKADCDSKVADAVAKLETAEAEHAEEIKKLKAEVAALKKAAK